MKQIKTILSSMAIAALCSGAASASNLWIIGDATLYGWSTDDATALVSEPDNDAVFTGTVYLKAGQDFKFMTVPDFGNEEIGSAPGAVLTDGEIALAKGTDDSGYGKIQVAESANYLLTVDTGSMTSTIVKSPYQATEIALASIFMVGSATPGEWSVDNGTPLRQVKDTPYIYKATRQALNAGTFKIATVIKGAGTWNGKYWYFRDADNAGKIALNQDGDLQWEIKTAEDYDITVNLLDSTIRIEKSSQSSVIGIESDAACEVEYFDLRGIKTDNPSEGIYIKREGNKTGKILIRNN